MRRIYFLLLTGIMFAGMANAQIPVTVTGNTNTTPNLLASYTSLAGALTDLNLVTAMTGPVILTCTGPNSETSPPTGLTIGSASLNAVLSPTNTVTINTTGGTVTLNAGVGTASPGSAAPDGILAIVGADYITIDGLTLTDGNGANPATMEFGIGLFKLSAADGAQNNTIQNCTITLNRLNNATGTSPAMDGSVGIQGYNSTPTAATTVLTITVASGTNSNNKFYTNTIQNCNIGIGLSGFASATLGDSGNDIGGASSGTGNQILNFGGGATTNPAAGIRLREQIGGCNVSYNTINNNNGSGVNHGTTLRGIYGQTGTSANVTISNNTITVKSAATTSALTAIENVIGATAAGNTVNITNNTITGCTYTTATSGAFTGILNSASASTVNITGNQLTSNATNATSGTTNMIQNTGAAPVAVNINSNNINGWTFNAATSGTFNGINNSGGSATTAISISSNNFQNITHTAAGTNAHVYITNSGSCLTRVYNSNTFTNLSVNTTGSVTFFTDGSALLSTGSENMNSNSIVTGFTKGGSGGTVTIRNTNGSSATGSTMTWNLNNFSNITLSGTTAFNGFINTDGGAPTKTITNNTINTVTISGGTSGAITGISSNFIGGTTSSISNNTITGITGQGAITGITIGATGSATTLNVSSNTVTGLTSNGTGGAVTGMSYSNPSTTGNVNGNIINSLSTTGASSTVAGIVVGGGATVNVSGNLLNAFTNTGTTSPLINGISVTSGTTVNVFKNKIYDFAQNTIVSTTSPAVNGISLSGGTTVNTYNNLVGDLKAPVASLTDAVRGISVTSTSTTTTQNVYYNTVYLNASSTGTNFGTTGIFHTISTTSTTATLNLRNNIIVNTSTAAGTGLTVAYRRSAGAASNLANYASTSNNNLFYAGTPSATNLIYSDGTSTAQTLAAYKAGVFTAGTIAPRDAASVSENPPFLSTSGASSNFLHIDPSIATQVESGAVVIGGITDDYDGNTRNVSTPDIGADEGTFTLSDLTGPSISYTNLGNTSCTTDRTLSATITDASGVNTTPGTMPRLYYRRSAGPNADANTFNDNTSGTAGWKYVEASNASSPFSFTTNYSLLSGGAGVASTNVIEYFVVAQDNAGTPNVSINTGTFTTAATSVALVTGNFPVTGANSYTIVAAGLSGTVTIGAAGTYTTLTEAGGLFSAINTNGMSGNVTANIVDATLTENGTNILNAINYNGCASGPYTLTIKPTTPTSLSGSSAGAIITLSGADNVIIDGSIGSTANTVCPASAATRDMTITNTNAGTSSAVVWLQTIVTDAATNNTVKNCNIVGSGNTQTLFGIGSGAAPIGTGSLGIGNNNNAFVNNNISKTQYGIYSQGASAANKNTGTIINQNIINTVSPNNVQKGGIWAGFENGITISGNSISGMNLSGDAFGISLGTNSWVATTTTGNEVINATVSNNIIGQVQGSGTNSAAGIIVAPATAGTTIIANNMIYGVISNATPGDLAAGIFAMGGSGSTTQIYYNSVFMSGDRGAGTTANSFALAIGGTTPVVDIKNNILINTQTTASTGKSYAIGLGYSSTVGNYTNLSSNNNDLFTSGANGAFACTGTLNAGTDRTSLALWTTETGRDGASKNALPAFISATDLHLVAADNGNLTNLESQGVVVSTITNDIDCTNRPNGSAPDIGADEYAGIAGDVVPPVITYTPLGNTCVTTGVTLTATITDPGSGVPTSGVGLPVLYWKVNAGSYTAATATSLGSGQYQFSFGSGAAGNVISYYIVAQDAAAPPNVAVSPAAGASGFTTNPPAASTPPTTPSTFTIVTTLSGTYTVGSGGAYATLTAAVADYNSKCIGGAVIFSLTDASYSGSETFPIVINLNATASATNTLTIRPASTITPTISGSSSTTLIDFSGARYVTIDGSNSGGTTKDLTISNTNTSGATIRFINDATNNVVKNSILKGVSTSTTNGVVFFSTTSGTTGNDNNTIQNNDISGGATATTYGFFNSGTGTSSTTKNSGIQVIGNRIFDFATTGIRDNDNSVGTVYTGNEIYEVTTQTTSLAGFRPSSTTIEGFVFSKNKIHDLKTSSTGSVYGIHLFDIAGTPNVGEVSNNFIALSEVTPLTLRGIYDQTATTEFYNIYYNSVSISGSVSGASNSEAYYRSVASNSNVKDNIFVNTRSGGTGKHYAIRTLGTLAGFVSDYNDIYAGSGTGNVFGYDGAADRVDLAAWQAAVTQDANSKSIQPNFTSATDLHLVVSSNGLLDNQGTSSVGISTDIDGDQRTGNTDMGADEFTAVVGIDMGATTLVAPAASGCYTAAETVTVTIKNYSVATIDFSVNNVTVNVTATGGYSSNVVLNSGTLAAGATQNVPMPATINMSAPGTYTFNANTVVTGDITPGNDAMTAVNRINKTMGGTYLVGTGQIAPNYATLTAAVADYNNASCITAPIIFELQDASYSTRETGTGETFPIVINGNGAASAVNNLTIKPKSGSTITISGSSATAIIQLYGADYVTIDGSNSGGTDKSLTITNTNTSTSSAVVWIGSTGAADGATDNTIKNCIISGQATLTTVGDIIVGSGTTLGGSAETSNSNLTIQNNTLNRAVNGIYSNGNASVFDKNMVITGNTVGSTVAADKMGYRGISVQNAQNFTISNNTVTGIASSTSSSSRVTGISIYSNIAGGNIYGNKITDIKQTNTTGWGSNGIGLSATTTASSVNVYNNFISDVASQGYSSSNSADDNGSGIAITAGGGYNVYYNSINTATSQPLAGSFTQAINVTSGVTAAGAIDLRNNILSNTTTNTGGRYGIYSEAANTVFAAIDYNDYYVAGTLGSSVGLGYLGSSQTTLTGMQTAFGGNTNSQNALPTFTSPTDLHLVAPDGNNYLYLESKAVAIGGITTDIDGTTRPNNGVTSLTDIGADEFVGALPACPKPTVTGISSVTATTASVAFTCVSCTGTYIVEYGPITPYWAPGTSAGAGSGSSLVQAGGSSPIALSGLTSGTAYKVYVRQVCTGPAYSNNSDSTNLTTFTTLCTPATVPYLERFDAPTVAPAVPTCVTVENVNGGNTWRTVTNLPSGDDPASYHNFMRLDYETDGITPANDWFFTRGITLAGGTQYRLRFHYRNSDGVTYTENLEVKYGLSNNAASMTTGTLFSHTGINSNIWKDTLVDFIPPGNGDYYIGFHGFSAANQAFLCVDNVSVILTPACTPPVDVTITSITSGSGSVSFNSPGGTNFYVEYGAVGFTPGTGAGAGGGTVIGPVGASPVALSGLTAETNYDVYVRRDCGGSFSPNSLPRSFKTIIGNDDAPGAYTLTVGGGCITDAYTNFGATASTNEVFPSCAGSIVSPVWFKFVAPASGAVRIKTTTGTGAIFDDSKVGLFSATNVADYTTFSIISCDEDGGSGGNNALMSVVYATGLTAGTTYYIAVDKYDVSVGDGTFCITVDELNSSMLATSNTCASSYQTPFGSNTSYAGWVPLVDASSNLVALVKNPAGGSVSSYSVAENINGSVRTDATTGQKYLNRNFRINNSSATNVDVQFFFLTSELTSLQTADTAVTLANLGVTHQTGTTCQDDFLTANGTNSYLAQTGNGTSSDGLVKWIQTTTPDFSNFYLHTSKTPVTLKTFLQGAYSTALLRHKDVTTGWRDILRNNATRQPYDSAAYGFYAGGENVPASIFNSTAGTTGGAIKDIVDWVLLELRTAPPPALPVAIRAAFIREDGSIVDLDDSSSVTFRGVPDGSYYVSIRHRNHLGIRSRAVQILNGSLGSTAAGLLDFSSDSTKAYRDNTITTNDPVATDPAGPVFMMWGGDANQNGFTRVTTLFSNVGDPITILGSILGGNPNLVLPIYSPGDVNMDGVVRMNTLFTQIGDRVFILGTPLLGNPAGSRKEHK